MTLPCLLQLGWRGVTLELRTGRPELCDALELVYRPFVIHRESQRDPAVPADTLGWRASVDGHELSYQDLSEAVVGLDHEIEQRLMSEPTSAVLHAAAVIDGDRTVILAGPSGAGKTTIALECVRRGFRYLGDEFVTLGATGAALHPFPRAANLKRPSPGLPAGRLLEVQEDGHYRGFFLPDHHSDLQRVPLTSPWIVFLERQDEAAVGARRLPRGEVLARLLCSTFQLLGHEAAVWPSVSGLAVRATACSLVHEDAEAHLDLALSLLGEG